MKTPPCFVTYTTSQLYKLPDIDDIDQKVLFYEYQIRHQPFSDSIIVRNPNIGALASGLVLSKGRLQNKGC